MGQAGEVDDPRVGARVGLEGDTALQAMGPDLPPFKAGLESIFVIL